MKGKLLRRGERMSENTAARHDEDKPKLVLVYDARGNGDGGVAPTITGDHQNRITDYTAIVVEVNEENDVHRETLF